LQFIKKVWVGLFTSLTTWVAAQGVPPDPQRAEMRHEFHVGAGAWLHPDVTVARGSGQALFLEPMRLPMLSVSAGYAWAFSSDQWLSVDVGLYRNPYAFQFDPGVLLDGTGTPLNTPDEIFRMNLSSMDRLGLQLAYKEEFITLWKGALRGHVGFVLEKFLQRADYFTMSKVVASGNDVVSAIDLDVFHSKNVIIGIAFGAEWAVPIGDRGSFALDLGAVYSGADLYNANYTIAPGQVQQHRGSVRASANRYGMSFSYIYRFPRKAGP